MGQVAEPYEHIFAPRDYMPLPKPNMKLALLNKQLHGEFMAMLFSQTTFSFRQHGQLFRFLYEISTASICAIKSIELKFDHETLLTMFGAPVRQWDRIGWSYCRGCPHVTNPSLKLQHVRVCFPHPRGHKYHPYLHQSCQRSYCEWALTAMHGSIKHIPHVELDGCIKDDQKAVWLELLAQGSEVDLTPSSDDHKSLKLQTRSASPSQAPRRLIKVLNLLS